jgi:DNA-binding CsgD family transcriptional regulator
VPKLTPHDQEQVRLHPYHTSQVLKRTPFLRSLDDIASAHHERLDGSGYYRGVPASALPATARVLAAADTFHAKLEPRPHREALGREAAASYVRGEASAGRLDPMAVEAVLTAAGQQGRAERSGPRLTPREVEILVQVARGGSMREIARALTISPKTVDGHLQRIYPKIGVSTRAGATLFAVQQGLLSPLEQAAQKGENSP